MRGGGWNNNDNNCRSANRNNNTPTNCNNNIGFRVVWSASTPEQLPRQGLLGYGWQSVRTRSPRPVPVSVRLADRLKAGLRTVARPNTQKPGERW